MEVVDDGVDEAVAAAGVGGVRELVQSVSKSKEIKQNLITIHEYVKAINWMDITLVTCALLLTISFIFA